MRWVTNVMRRTLGIHEYVPGMSAPRALVRKPTWYGARGNGRLAGLPPQAVHPVIDRLTRQHRSIRQMIADMRRTGGS